VANDFLAAGDVLHFFRRLKQWQSAGDGLAGWHWQKMAVA